MSPWPAFIVDRPADGSTADHTVLTVMLSLTVWAIAASVIQVAASSLGITA